MSIFISLEMESREMDNLGLDQIIILRHNLRILKDGYEEVMLPVPPWVRERLENANITISTIATSEIKRKLRKLKARREELRTREEKRDSLDVEIEELQKLLS